MSTLRISNIEAKSVPASATVDEKVKITNSSGDTLVFIDGKTSGITTVGINTTDSNITFDANSNVLVTGIITATRFSGQITPTSLEIGSNIKLGNAGVITATSFVGSGANLTNLPVQVTLNTNADNRVITGGSGVNLNGEANLTYNGSILHNQISAGARNDFSTSADGLIIEKGGNTGLSIDPGSTGTAAIYFPNESNHSIASITHNNSTGELRVRGEDHIVFSTVNNTERARIDSSGRVLIGTTSTTGISANGDDLIIGSIGDSTSRGITFATTTDATIRWADAGDNAMGRIQYLNNSDIMTFHTSNSPRLRLDSDGMKFGSDSAAANALNDYEEGDHDTTVTMSGDTSFSYSSRTLAYTKIGRAVFVTGRINMSGAGGSSFRFTLPFTCGDGSFKYETSNEFQNIRFNDGYTFRIRSNTAYVDLQSDGSDTGIGTGSPHLNVNIFYFTA